MLSVAMISEEKVDENATNDSCTTGVGSHVKFYLHLQQLNHNKFTLTAEWFSNTNYIDYIIIVIIIISHIVSSHHSTSTATTTRPLRITLHLQVSRSAPAEIRKSYGKNPGKRRAFLQVFASALREKSIHRERCSKYFVFSAPPYAAHLFAHLRRPSCVCVYNIEYVS